jgi:hypothetical protein
MRQGQPTINAKEQPRTNDMKPNRKTWSLVCAAALAITLNASAQLGGLKQLAVSAGVGTAPPSAEETALMNQVTPASVLLSEASEYYRKALEIKKELAKANVKSGDLPSVKLTKDVIDNQMKEIEAAMSKWQQPLSEEQKELCGKAHGKLTEGTLALAALATPTAIGIKKVTDSNPAALLQHPELALLGVLCAKDSAKLMSFTKTAADFNRKWGAPVSDRPIPDNAFASN